MLHPARARFARNACRVDATSRCRLNFIVGRQTANLAYPLAQSRVDVRIPIYSVLGCHPRSATSHFGAAATLSLREQHVGTRRQDLPVRQ